MATWTDRIHRGVIDDARDRQARQRRRVVAAVAAAIIVASLAFSLLGGGGAPRGGIASSGHASAPTTASAGMVGAVPRDCGAGNDPLRGTYTDAALRAALASVEGQASPLRYSTCADAIFGAIHGIRH